MSFEDLLRYLFGSEEELDEVLLELEKKKNSCPEQGQERYY